MARFTAVLTGLLPKHIAKAAQRTVLGRISWEQRFVGSSLRIIDQHLQALRGKSSKARRNRVSTGSPPAWCRIPRAGVLCST